MSYSFTPNHHYRMPTHFGPSLGPRQGLDNRRYTCATTPQCQYVSATFAAEKKQLEALLPPGFILSEHCQLTFFFEYFTEIEWLAGRGYNTFGVSIPVIYRGKHETVEGSLLLILWENKADPIITGREDLGFSKVYAELPELQIVGNQVTCRASWDGFEFASLTLENVTEISPDQLPESPPSEGTLHYKYIPKTGVPGEADAAYATLTPASRPNEVLEQAKSASEASLCIHQGTWEQLPTLIHIVDTLAGLTLGECLNAVMLTARGGKDLGDTRILS